MDIGSWVKRQLQLWQNRDRQEQTHRSIRLVLISGTILAVGVTAYSSYQVVRRIILESLKSNAQLQVQKAGTEIDDWLATLLAQVETIANTTQVRSMNWAVAKPYLQLEQERLVDYYMFVLINPDGSYYTTLQGFAKGRNLSDRRHFKRAMAGEIFVDNPVISRTTGKSQVNIAAPIWSVPP